MQTRNIGPLRVHLVDKGVAPPGSSPPLVCVFLHGFGAPGYDLVGIAEDLDVPPGTRLVFPEALHALRDLARQPLYGDARAWWMIDVDALERAIARGEARDLSAQVPAGLAEARAAVGRLLDALRDDRSLVPAGHRLVLGGFSQGAMLSLDLALREPGRALAGLVLLSGTLLAAEEWLPRMPARRGLPVFQSHGTEDALLSFDAAERLRDALVAAGLDVTFDRFVGPHAIPAATLARLGAWLREHAAVEASGPTR